MVDGNCRRQQSACAGKRDDVGLTLKFRERWMSLAKMFHATLFAGLHGLGFGSRGSSALAQCWSLKLMVRSTARYAEKLPLFFFFFFFFVGKDLFIV